MNSRGGILSNPPVPAQDQPASGISTVMEPLPSLTAASSPLLEARTQRLLGTAFAGAACLAASAQAGVVSTWIAPAGGLFTDEANWSPAPPGGGDTALFDGVGAQTVEVDSPSLVDRVVVRDGQVSLLLTNPLEAASSTALLPSWVVGDTAGLAPAVSASGGALLGRFMEIASAPGSAGLLQVGADASLELTEILSVGPRGGADVVVQGQLVARRLVAGVLAGGHGDVAVHGPAATATLDELVIMGQKGFGSLTVAAQASCDGAELIIGLNSGSNGLVTVSGAGSVLAIPGSVDVGFNGTGALEVRDGASATFGDDVLLGVIPMSFIPPNPPGGDGTVVVEGAGSAISIAGALRVPVAGFGHVAVRDGGRITAASLDFANPNAAGLEFRFASAEDPPALVLAGAVTGSLVTPVQCDVSFTPGFAPGYGDVFQLIVAPTIASAFEVLLPAVPAPLLLSAAIEATGSGSALVVRVSADADLDGDGTVDGADLGVLLSAWGTAGPGDFNGDAVVDGADLGILLSLWTA